MALSFPPFRFLAAVAVVVVVCGGVLFLVGRLLGGCAGPSDIDATLAEETASVGDGELEEAARAAGSTRSGDPGSEDALASAGGGHAGKNVERREKRSAQGEPDTAGPGGPGGAGATGVLGATGAQDGAPGKGARAGDPASLVRA